MLPIIAIVGRPNVGKSTLFNRLIGKRLAVTSPIAGTTRDRIYQQTEIAGRTAILVDTGGLAFEKKQNIEADVQTQARIAVQEAHLILFVIDASKNLTAPDFDASKFLRSSQKPVIVIAHKADNKSAQENMREIFSMGFGEAVPSSSIHNIGIIDLEDEIGRAFKKMKFPKQKPAAPDKTVKVAIVGKPNVGKSSIVNAILGKQRTIVSEMPGTTIDATDTKFIYQKTDYVLVDTAGLRRRGKRGFIEKFGVLRALQAISQADVACIVLDAGTGLANQDLHVSQYALDSGRGIIIAVNKADLMEEAEKEQKKMLAVMQYRMGFIPWAPVIFTSAVTKKNIFKILELSKQIAQERLKKIPARELSVWLQATIYSHPPTRNGKTLRIASVKQNPKYPTEFVFTASRPDLIHFSYIRYLENELRRKFGFFGTALKIKMVKD